MINHATPSFPYSNTPILRYFLFSAAALLLAGANLPGADLPSDSFADDLKALEALIDEVNLSRRSNGHTEAKADATIKEDTIAPVTPAARPELVPSKVEGPAERARPEPAERGRPPEPIKRARSEPAPVSEPVPVYEPIVSPRPDKVRVSVPVKGRTPGVPTLMIIPDRYAVIQLSFDIMALRPMSLIVYDSQPGSVSPAMHIWDGKMQDWVLTSIGEYDSARIFKVVPQRIILVGRDMDLPSALAVQPAWSSSTRRIPTLSITTIVNELNKDLKFTRREWKLLAERHGLKLKDITVQRRRYDRYEKPVKKMRPQVPPAVILTEVPEPEPAPKKPVALPELVTEEPSDKGEWTRPEPVPSEVKEPVEGARRGFFSRFFHRRKKSEAVYPEPVEAVSEPVPEPVIAPGPAEQIEPAEESEPEPKGPTPAEVKRTARRPVRGFFSRLFRRRRKPEPPVLPEPVTASEPDVVSEPVAVIEPVTEPEPDTLPDLIAEIAEIERHYPELAMPAPPALSEVDLSTDLSDDLSDVALAKSEDPETVPEPVEGAESVRQIRQVGQVGQIRQVKPIEWTRRPMTLRKAIDRAIVNNEQIAVLQAAIETATQQKRAAFDIADPELRLSYSEDSTVTKRLLATSTDEGESSRIALRVFPPNPWIVSARISAGNANIYAAMADLRSAKRLLSSEVKRLFAETDYLERDLKILNRLVSVHGSALKLVKERTQQGQAAIQDLLVVSRRYLAALSDRNQTNRRLEDVRGRLALLIAVPSGELKVAVNEGDFSTDKIMSMDTDKLEQSALTNRADLHALTWRAKAAKALYREARSARIPWLSFVQGSVGTQSSLDQDMLGLEPDESDSDEWRIDAGINVPIFAWINNASDVRLSEYRQAKVWETEATKRITREIRDALSSIQSIEKIHTRYESGSGAVIRAMQKVLDDLGDESGLPQDDITRIKEQILESQRLKLGSLFEYRLAVIRLQKILGSDSFE